MAQAVVRAIIEGSWRTLAPIWSLTCEADDSGPTVASWMMRTKDAPQKFADVAVDIGGLTVFDGWVEDVERDGRLCTVTAAGEQRSLDDTPYRRTYMLSGFGQALDARDAPTANQSYWARAGVVLNERTVTLGMLPEMVYYAGQGMGVTYDLGEGNPGARVVWLHQEQMFLPLKFVYLVVRLHSTRSNHHPAVAGQYQDPDGGAVAVAGGANDMWRRFTFAETNFRYLSIFLYITDTHDLRTAPPYSSYPEYFIRFSQMRASTLPMGGTTVASLNGSAITPDQAIPHVLAQIPRLTAGRIDASTLDLHGLGGTDYQTPRQVLHRLNVEQWRVRVNPGRRLDFYPYPTLPAYTVRDLVPARLRYPETYSRVIVQYRDQGDEAREVVRSVPSSHPRTEVMSLNSAATEAQAGAIADAYMLDQSQRRIEGTATVPPGALLERPSGMSLHPSRALLAGGDRIYVDEAGDHGRNARVTYTHDTETAEVELSEPQDDLDRAMAHLELEPV